METNDSYRALVTARTPRSPTAKNVCAAFLCGGGICCAAEWAKAGFLALGATERDAGVWVTVSLIALSALLTGLGVYDAIARFAGAGTLVPVTGFANAVASAAQDSKSEGLILGVGSKMFTVAGPVILYGVLAGTVFGVIYRLLSAVGGIG